VAVAGCSSSGSDRSTPGGNGVNSGTGVASVTITAADGCTPDHTAFAAGPLTFTIENKDATAVSEVELLSGQRIVGEKENLPPGFTGTFSVTVSAGGYTLYCPGADPERRALTVTGRSSGSKDDTVAQLLADATKAYSDYVTTQVQALLAASRAFAAALHGDDLAAAQRAYIAARPFYEKIEPVAESFVVGEDSIDADLDARAGDVPAAKWRGFHRIEKVLFQTRTLAGTGHYGDLLVADVKRLEKLTSGLVYQPTELANGAQELLDEVAASKITGEEERYSHIDMLDITDNVEGAQQAFAQLEPAVRRIDPDLAGTIASAFGALDKLDDTYRTGSNPSGFVLYAALTRADKTKLAAAVKAVQEPLSRVAAKVANA
jgi:iron uptake system component EfeO